MLTETLEQYFEHRNTPSAGSPVGLAMVELLKLRPGIPFEEARALVNRVGASSLGPKACAKRVVEILDEQVAEQPVAA